MYFVYTGLGAAARIVRQLTEYAGHDAWRNLVVIYLMTMICTELMSNNAAAVLMFPIGHATATRLNVSAPPFFVAIMIGASCGFATPLGYQTHLMVYGPGGYRFSDFLRIGIPLNLLVGVVAVLVIPLAFPF